MMNYNSVVKQYSNILTHTKNKFQKFTTFNNFMTIFYINTVWKVFLHAHTTQFRSNFLRPFVNLRHILYTADVLFCFFCTAASVRTKQNCCDLVLKCVVNNKPKFIRVRPQKNQTDQSRLMDEKIIFETGREKCNVVVCSFYFNIYDQKTTTNWFLFTTSRLSTCHRD